MNFWTRPISSFVFAALLAVPCLSLSDIQPLHRGKKVALVLSGGGALGFAHLGVLEWLEQHHIPVDYLVGTSAGAVYGGWYSTGGMLFPQELNVWPQSQIKPESSLHLQGLRGTLEAIDWDQISVGTVPYRQLTERRKEEQTAYPSLIQLEMIPGLIPEKTRGVFASHDLGLLIDGFAAPFPIEALHNPDGYGYDNLPIPFRASAALLTGKYDILNSQNYRKFLVSDSLISLQNPSNPNSLDLMPLGQAIRASMAFPLLFTPVSLKDGVLVDAGFLDNVDALEPLSQPTWRKHLDQIIAIDVLPGAEGPSKGRIQQLDGNVRLMQAFLDQKRYGPLDYRAWRFIALKGYQMMEGLYQDSKGAYRKELDSLSLGESEWNAYLRAKQRIVSRVSPAFTIRSAELDSSAMIGSLAVGNLSERFKGMAYDAQDPRTRLLIEADLDKAVGQERRDSIGYFLSTSKTGDGTASLLLHPEPKSYGPPYILRQVYGETASHLPSMLSLGQRRIAPIPGSSTSEVVTDVSLGTENSMRIELFTQPHGGQGYLAPALFYQPHPPDLTRFQTGKSDTSFQRLGGQFAVGLTPDTFDDARLGLIAGRLYSGLYPLDQGQFAAAEAAFSRDTQDFVIAPTKGSRESVEAEWHIESPRMERQFPQLKGEYSLAQSVARNDAVFTRIDAGTSFGYAATIPDEFSLGGFNGVGILRPGQLEGDSFTYFAAGYRHRLCSLPALLGALYGSTFYESGNVASQNGMSSHAQDLSIGMLADTRLGPFWIGASVAQGRYTSFQFVFGRI